MGLNKVKQQCIEPSKVLQNKKIWKLGRNYLEKEMGST